NTGAGDCRRGPGCHLRSSDTRAIERARGENNSRHRRWRCNLRADWPMRGPRDKDPSAPSVFHAAAIPAFAPSRRPWVLLPVPVAVVTAAGVAPIPAGSIRNVDGPAQPRHHNDVSVHAVSQVKIAFLAGRMTIHNR